MGAALVSTFVLTILVPLADVTAFCQTQAAGCHSIRKSVAYFASLQMPGQDGPDFCRFAVLHDTLRLGCELPGVGLISWGFLFSKLSLIAVGFPAFMTFALGQLLGVKSKHGCE